MDLEYAMKKFCQITLVCLLGLQNVALMAGEIDFVEKYALSENRERVLSDLVPGTDEYYYYQSLQAQHTQRFKDIESILKSWIARHGETARAREILYRQALLTYNDNPEATVKFIRERLNLRFNHQPKNVDRAADLSVVLDPKRISEAAFFKAAISEKRNTGKFESTGLGALIRYKALTAEQRQHLLSRLQRPDYDGLVDLINADLEKRPFGSYGVHRTLLPAQLDRILATRPTLLNNGPFIEAYLANLHAGPEADWTYDVDARVEHFTRVWRFVRRLPASQNSLKAHMLFHLLSAKSRKGTFDDKLFLEYLRLPRQSPIVAREYLEESRKRKTPIAVLSADFRALSSMPTIGSDEPMIRAHLAQVFVEADSYDMFAKYLEESYVKQVFAETKILNGLGDLEKWTAWLSPTQFKQLRERVDIQFSGSSREQFGANEPVSLDVDVKNVKSMIVKIYEINALNYYLSEGSEITSDLNLDGMKPNVEKRFDYGEPSYRRVSHHFEFPELEKPGVYVVDFIGNGKSSRALVRKGNLIATSRPTAAGQALTVFNGDRELIKTAKVYLNGRQFTANSLGEILVPFTTSPGRKTVVLENEGISALHHVIHRDEKYELSAGFYIDRESLIRREKSRVVIRPKLTIHGAPMSTEALSDIKLNVTSVNLQGTPTTQTIEDFKLTDDGDAVHEFYTPPHAHSINISLTAKVKRVSQGGEQAVGANASFSLNSIRNTKRFLTSHLTRAEGLYAVDILGLTGEPYVGIPVQVMCKHRDFTKPVYSSLKTAENGRIILGVLPGIDSVQINLPDGTQRQWQLDDARYRYPTTIHRRAGAVISLPYLGSEEVPQRDEFSLLEVRGGRVVADHFSRLKLDGGRLEIGKLPVGDYTLRLARERHQVTVRVTAGQQHHTALVGEQRVLDANQSLPMFIASMQVKAGTIRVQLENAGKQTRLHVFATRFRPDFSPYDRFGSIRLNGLGWVRPAPQITQYVEERDLGDELQYIIDRQYAEKFPGNLLEPPSLLINPWAVRSTQTGTQNPASGDDFARLAAPSESAADDAADGASIGDPGNSNVYMDYLAQTSTALLDVVVDENGVATINRDELNGLHMVHFVAIDNTWTDYREISLAEKAWIPADMRLASTFPLDAHVAQQQRIKPLQAGSTLTLDEDAISRLTIYNGLDKAFSLYRTSLPNSAMGQFDFLVQWNTLTEEKKVELYDKYACHELHLFLNRRDKKFFDEHVARLIRDKKEKQFMDEYLLGLELKKYTHPWAFQRLNVLERLLLADRHPELRETTRRHLLDLVRQNPIAREQTMAQFEIASGIERLGTRSRNETAKSDKLATLKPGEWGMFKGYKNSNANGAGAAANKLMLGGVAGLKDADGDSSLGIIEEQRKQLAERKSSLGKKSASRRAFALPQVNRESLDLYYLELSKEKSSNVLFRQTDQTKEWAESQYYRIENISQNGQLVGPNRFWQDYAERNPDEPFLSGHFPEAVRSLTEAMAALAVLDLPLVAEPITPGYKDGNILISAATPAVIVYEESANGEARTDVPVLTSQRFFDDSPAYQSRNQAHKHLYVEDEFIAGVPYGCQIVVTNPTATARSLNVLIQVPQGAVSLGDSRPTRTVPVDVPPFQTQIVGYSFYFPVAGQFDHYPVHIALDEEIVAFADVAKFKVLDEPTKFDTQSWAYVSQRGTDNDIFDFVKSQPLESVELDDVAYRLRDRQFYTKLIQALDSRRVFHRTTWSYSVMHKDAPRIDAFLQHEDGFVNYCGPIIDSPVLDINPLARGTYQHYEYRPLINARAHQLSMTRQILNDRMSLQYHRLLNILAHQREILDTDRLAVVYYLTAQGRTEESLAHFAKIRRESLETAMQYDYMSAYLDFFVENPDRAEEIVAKYVDYPVQRWQQAFASISSQIAELSGDASKVVDDADRNQTQTVRADLEPVVTLKQEGDRVFLTSKNVKKVSVSYYAMDIEVLFSRKPFVQDYAEKFSYIRPNSQGQLDVSAKGLTEVAIPAELSQENVLVEVRGAGKKSSLMVLANKLRVDLSDNFGQLSVRQSETRRPLNSVYVKVYAKHKDGSIQFYKDGYTDLRGHFDYASLSTNQLDQVDRFAVLVFSEKHGAMIQEIAPPAR
jgi:hypothetical protein